MWRLNACERSCARGEGLSDNEAAGIRAKVEHSYEALQAAGVIRAADRFELVGGPVAAGYWKSYVEVERGKRWFWSQAGYVETVTNNVVGRLVDGTDAASVRGPGVADDVDVIKALARLRRSEGVGELAPADVYPMVQVAIAGVDAGIQAALDLRLTVVVAGTTTEVCLSYLAEGDAAGVRERVESWIGARRDLLNRRRVSVDLQVGMEVWRVPSSEELQWLVYASDAPPLPEEYFGKSILDWAFSKFDGGDVAGAATAFGEMLTHRERPGMRNNYAYCWLILGQYAEARSALDAIPSKDVNYMVRHNLAMQEILSGSAESGVGRLKVLWEEVRRERDREKVDAYCMLTLEAGLESVKSRAGLPVDAAVVLNLVILGEMEYADAIEALERDHVGECGAWLEWVREAGSGEARRIGGLAAGAGTPL